MDAAGEKISSSAGAAEVETERLRLRPLAHEDLERLHAILAEPGVRRFLCDDVVVPRERVAEILDTSAAHFERHGFGLWALMLGEELAGFCGLLFVDDTPEVEILFGLAERHWGRGLATEAARAVLGRAFETHQLPRVVGIANEGNLASYRVMEKAGMKFRRAGKHHEQDVRFYEIETP